MPFLGKIVVKGGEAVYHTLNQHYQEKFGCKVYKLSIDGGFSCPNRDGTVGTGGCIFCNETGSGDFAVCGKSITRQLQEAKKWVEQKNKGGKYIAYFQSFTNTYAPADVLRSRYLEAIAPEEIVGIAIGTRPDCLGEETMAVLKEIHAIKPVTIELGLQTIHEASVEYIRRSYVNQAYYDAVARLKHAGIEVVTHIILGLPGETADMAAQTTRSAVEAGTDGVKFHLLHVLKNTDLEKEYLAGKFSCLTMEEYGDWLCRCMKEIPEHIIVHRITGDGAKRNLVAPLWSGDKKRVLNYLNKRLTEIL